MMSIKMIHRVCGAFSAMMLAGAALTPHQTHANSFIFEPAVKTGDAVGNMPGVTYDKFGFPAVSDAGQAAFFATLTRNVGGITSNIDDVLAKQVPGNTPIVIAQEREAAPGTSEIYSGFGLPAFPTIDGNANVSYFASLFGDVNVNAAIYGENGGPNPSLIVREGDTIPGTTNTFVTPDNPFVNEAGDLAFRMTDGPNDQRIYRQKAGEDFELIADRSFDAPGQGLRKYNNLGAPSLADNGNIAFYSQLTGGSPANQYAIFRDKGDGIELAVVDGTAVPGAVEVDFIQVGFGTLSSQRSPDINSHGRIAFATGLVGAGVVQDNNTAMFREDEDGVFHLVAREGTIAPDAEGNPSNAIFAAFDAPGLNDNDRIAFKAQLRGDRVTAENDFALYAEDPISGKLVQVLREGDTLEVAPGDLRIVEEFGFVARSAYNDADQLAFQVVFTDNTQAVYLVSSVPEPGAMGLLGTGLLLTLNRRRACR